MRTAPGPSQETRAARWETFVKYVNDPAFVKVIFERARQVHAENPERKEKERLKEKLSGIRSQIEALAERLAELPKAVSAQPIYAQMEKLEAIKRDLEIALTDLQASQPSVTRLSSLENFDAFAKHYREFILREMDADQKKQAIQKFIRRIEVGPDTVKIHFIVDEEHFSEELRHGRRGRPGTGESRAAESDFLGSPRTTV